eukprot:TRINITY_DN11607_c1_g1_i3.p1 TRINITY_DN11607_c1_g1~~TRINITY_DN11607_c1_g1_i3.p1  ORF type:complete len:293 (-),score=71.89 TRINITY_DN11607_c1_g1_i3:128-1006(-)
MDDDLDKLQALLESERNDQNEEEEEEEHKQGADCGDREAEGSENGDDCGCEDGGDDCGCGDDCDNCGYEDGGDESPAIQTFAEFVNILKNEGDIYIEMDATEITERTTPDGEFIHGFFCDECPVPNTAIIGARYNCSDCKDCYDLCKKCYTEGKYKQTIHATHKFSAYTKPSDEWNLTIVEDSPQGVRELGWTCMVEEKKHHYIKELKASGVLVMEQLALRPFLVQMRDADTLEAIIEEIEKGKMYRFALTTANILWLKTYECEKEKAIKLAQCIPPAMKVTGKELLGLDET